MSKEIKVQCPFCGKEHEINPARMLAEMSYEGSTLEERKARTAKATLASAKARKNKKLVIPR